MPRKPRIHFPGAIYHVITRGNNQEHIFAGKKDKRYYLDKLREYRRDHCIELLIYAILDNHAHFTFRIEETPLSDIMHRLQQSYAIYYNREYEQTGHVFQGRYKAHLCDNERYLLALLRYIHLNPVEANLSPTLDYPWSSHAYYAGKKRDSLVNTSLIRSILQQQESSNPAEEYLRFMGQKAGELPQPDYLSSLQEKPGDNEVLDIIDDIITPLGIGREELFSGSRSSAVSTARKIVILTLHHKHNWRNGDIASLISVDRSYVSKILACYPRPR